MQQLSGSHQNLKKESINLQRALEGLARAAGRRAGGPVPPLLFKSALSWTGKIFRVKRLDLEYIIPGDHVNEWLNKSQATLGVIMRMAKLGVGESFDVTYKGAVTTIKREK